VRPRGVERVGGDAGAVLGPEVVPAKDLDLGSEGGPAEHERFGRIAHDKLRQIAAYEIGVRMLGAERSPRGILSARLRPFRLVICQSVFTSFHQLSPVRGVLLKLMLCRRNTTSTGVLLLV
jgi:hypothetical protein